MRTKRRASASTSPTRPVLPRHFLPSPSLLRARSTSIAAPMLRFASLTRLCTPSRRTRRLTALGKFRIHDASDAAQLARHVLTRAMLPVTGARQLLFFDNQPKRGNEEQRSRFTRERHLFGRHKGVSISRWFHVVLALFLVLGSVRLASVPSAAATQAEERDEDQHGDASSGAGVELASNPVRVRPGGAPLVALAFRPHGIVFAPPAAPPPAPQLPFVSARLQI
jgi:hypothetical protein